MEDYEHGLIYLAQNGDKKAFMKLYELYADKIYIFVVVRINNASDAEDIISIIWEKVLINLESFKGELKDSFKLWIFTIARNTVYRYYQQNSPQRKTFNLDEVRNIDQEKNIQMKDFYEERKVRTLIHKLPQKQKETVKLKYFANLKNKEIATQLHQSEKTVASNLSRALKKLFQWMQ